ncbi:MAG: PH domain-containing protein [Patescibacteria group bacterium]|jgi:uncharacterized membrane protein YdbT with pleckstrin-like domain|nr:PH domain-containing protein [Patescibacteria group bacterium]
MQEHKRDRVKKRIAITGDEEDVVAVTRQFPIVLRLPLILGMLVVLIGFVPWVFAFGLSTSWLGLSYAWMGVCAAILFAYWLRAWVGWHYSIYVLTNQRLLVVKQNGFFTREVADLALHNIQNVNYSIKGFQGSLFGFGSLSIDTLSGAGGLELRYVHKPAKLQKQIMNEVHKYGPANTKEQVTKSP